MILLIHLHLPTAQPAVGLIKKEMIFWLLMTPYNYWRC